METLKKYIKYSKVTVGNAAWKHTTMMAAHDDDDKLHMTTVKNAFGRLLKIAFCEMTLFDRVKGFFPSARPREIRYSIVTTH